MRVLAVDDDEIALELITSTIIDSGYEAETAQNGIEALEKLEAGQFRLVISDWVMPGMDGIEFCRRVRERNIGRYTYIILLSGRDGAVDVVEGFNAGADDFITKPFNPLELRVRLRTGERILSAQSQKLESIGQLAAGIAHEINTPLQYLGDNTDYLEKGFQRIVRVLEQYDELLTAAKAGTLTDDIVLRADAVVQDAQLKSLLEEIPEAIHDSQEGIQSAARIVRAMKEFSHPGAEDKAPIDINEAIRTTVTVARNEWKYVADLQTDLDSALPLVPCMPGEITQVILNLIVNAAHAISDSTGEVSSEQGMITVSTRHKENGIEIRVSDTGGGIPPEIHDRIFEPFFTTKEVGRGTGQGLSISHSVVVKKHCGKIWFETELGVGTTFVVWLPLESGGGTESVQQPARSMAFDEACVAKEEQTI